MLFPKPNSDVPLGNSQFTQDPQFDAGFEKLIESTEGEYLDPSRHDLTGDKEDLEESKTKRRELFCFHCNRLEMHGRATRFGAVYSFLIGLTMGLVKVIGPYYCRCCGHRRFFGSDQLHPKFWLHQRRLRQRRKTRRSR